MKITPKDIARSLIDTMLEQKDVSYDKLCDGALQLLHKTNPGLSRRAFLKLVEREVSRRGDVSAGLLIVPTEKSISADTILPLLEKKSGKKVMLDRSVDPELIGGTVLHVDHRRLDASIQGALQDLLRTCLLPLD